MLEREKRYKEWCELQATLRKIDIFHPKATELRQRLNDALIDVLIQPIITRRDAVRTLTALNALVAACGTYERPIRRALLNLIRFMGHG